MNLTVIDHNPRSLMPVGTFGANTSNIASALSADKCFSGPERR
jgi:hypothetical protein